MDTGYLSHCLGVYLIGLIAVIVFIFFNCGDCRNLKELIIGGLVLLSIYTLIMMLGAFAIPLLSI